MKRRIFWIGSVVVWVLAIATVAWLPDYRFEQEIRAARAEGVPLEVEDVRRLLPAVPDEQNAAPLIQAAIRRNAITPFDHNLAKVVDGSATAEEKAAARISIRKYAETVALWRRAASLPALDFKRKISDGYGISFSEVSKVRQGVDWPIAAARLGIEPEANLVAVARLSALLRSQPSTVEPMVGIGMGRQALQVSRVFGLEKRVEAALGPPTDVRRMILLEPSATMGLLREVRGRRTEGAWKRRLRFWLPDPSVRAVHGWRMLWRELPKDGTDYRSAAKILDRRMFEIESALVDASNGGVSAGGPNDGGGGARQMAGFETYRKTFR